MSTSDTDALDRIRDLFLAAIAERNASRAREDRIMSHLQDLIDNGKRLAAERSDLIADRDAERGRADTAERRAADLQARIDADDDAARVAKEDLDAEIAREAGLGTKASSNVLGQGLPPVITTAPSGATVTVAATTTTHQAVDGTVTTLDHVSGTATAVDPSGTPVEPVPSAVAEAQAAKDAVGVPIPSA